MRKAKITVGGLFPQDGSIPESCQLFCPWKEKDTSTGEWHCTVYDNISECRAKEPGNPKSVLQDSEEVAEVAEAADNVCRRCAVRYNDSPCETCMVQRLRNDVFNDIEE